jgi:hypothetical protein
VVKVLAIGPKVHRFKPGQGQWIFKGDKNPLHGFLQRGSKAVGPKSYEFMACLRSLQYERNTCRQNSELITMFLLLCYKVSVGYCQRALVDDSEMIGTQMGKYNRSVMVAAYGTPCTIPLHKQ